MNSSNSSDLCPDTYKSFVNWFSIFFTVLAIFEFVVLFALLLRHSYTFHPFFTTSFLLLILSYTLCNCFVFIKSIIEILDETSELVGIIDFIYACVYMYIPPCVVIGLLERLCSTFFVNSYENSRLWPVYIFSQVIAIVIVWWEMTLVYTDLIKYSQLGISTFICLVLIVLFFVNRKLTLDSRHKSKLTVRYQLTENVKALRIFVPFVVIDNCLSVMFVVSLHLFQVEYNFNIDTCRTVAGYTIWFMVFRVILLVVQLIMPIIVIRSHNTIWTKLGTKVRKSTTNEVSFQDQKDKKTVHKIKNSLGMDICGVNEDHFEQLQLQWLRKF